MLKVRADEFCIIGPLLAAGLFSALLLTGCGSQTGSVEGSILARSPVAGFQPLGFSSTVDLQARSNGRLVKSERVSPRKGFHFTAPPGNYKVVVVGLRKCAKDVVVKSGQSLTSNIRCSPAGPLAG